MTRSDIDHYHGLEVWGPVSANALQGLLEPLSLARGLRVLDVGCGRAHTLIGLAECLDARITGVDRSRAALTLARADAAQRAPEAQATWLESEANDLAFDEGTFDLILALGGPYQHDSLAQTLAAYAGWLQDRGALLHGDGFWMQPPPEAYLEATGLPHDALLSREEFLETARACGLVSTAHWIATRAASDHFEDTLLRNHETFARRHPGDPEVMAMIAGKRAWAEAQKRWGHETMGFSVDVFQRGP